MSALWHTMPFGVLGVEKHIHALTQCMYVLFHTNSKLTF